ncbi:MAG: hypothetical protein E6J52_01375 [Chloroflexi bacterium]|nr:MAG: hypothetical protein E6J52_01375 [Chloroflexota bacterium]
MRIREVPRLTIGIEEEFQIVDGEGQLKSHIDTLLTAARPHLGTGRTSRSPSTSATRCSRRSCRT